MDIRRVVRATINSLRGFRSAWRHHTPFRQEVGIALVLAPIGIWLGDSGLERAILVGAVALVILAELVNSAVETIVDRVGTEYHELSGRAKDMGSAVVLLAMLTGAAVWALVLLT